MPYEHTNKTTLKQIFKLNQHPLIIQYILLMVLFSPYTCRLYITYNLFIREHLLIPITNDPFNYTIPTLLNN